jgi:hypothetical protein
MDVESGYQDYINVLVYLVWSLGIDLARNKIW